MPRRYRRSSRYSRRVKPVKYSNETYCINDPSFAMPVEESYQAETVVVGSIEAAGVRKCKNFTITTNYSNTEPPLPLYMALVYVPEGTTPNALNLGNPGAAASFYEPNQNVILTGILNPDNRAQTFRTRLARNLNAGDSIFLLLRSPVNQAFEGAALAITVNYAIAF